MQASMQLVRKLLLAALLVGVLLIPELALTTAGTAAEDDPRRTYVVLLDEQVERVDFVLELILLYDAEVLF